MFFWRGVERGERGEKESGERREKGIRKGMERIWGVRGGGRGRNRIY